MIEVTVLFADTAAFGREDPAMQEKLAALAGTLSVGRQEKIRRFRQPGGKYQSLAAGLLLDAGLRRYGLCEREVRILTGENGKPYLPDFPQLHFNLSHSGTTVMAAFAPCPVGCDVEAVGAPNLRVAGRFFAQEEQALLAHCGSDEEQAELFYRLWTLKESYIKMLGTGMRTPLADFAAQPGTEAGICVDGRRLPCRCFEFSLPGCRAALCLDTETPEQEVEVCVQRDFDFYSFQNSIHVV